MEWFTSQMCVFIQQDDRFQYLLTAIEKLTWNSDSECTYCGKAPCGCGGDKSIYRLGKAVALFKSRMPLATPLFYLKEGSSVEIDRRECGRRDVYIPDEVNVVLENCRVIKKEVSPLSSIFEDEPVHLYVWIECAVTLYPYGRGAEKESEL